MTDATISDPDDLVIAFDGPRGRTQLSFSNELLTGPIEKFVSHLQAAGFDFEPSRVEDLREYLIGRRDGGGAPLAKYELRDGGGNALAENEPRRLETAKGLKTIADANGDEAHTISISDARRALNTARHDFTYISFDDVNWVNSFVKAAVKQADEGLLFVIENVPNASLAGRYKDAVAALRDKALRTPYPETFILVSIKEEGSAVLLGVEDGDFVDDEGLNYGLRIRAVSPILDKENELVWSPINLASKGKGFSAAIPLLSLIADCRSSVTYVKADEKLQRARLKRGKPAIPGYFRIEAPGPTVIALDAASKLTDSAKLKGTHASPRAHDRRGHPRHLANGKIVWVHECRVNPLAEHLTRGRSYYEIRL